MLYFHYCQYNLKLIFNSIQFVYSFHFRIKQYKSIGVYNTKQYIQSFTRKNENEKRELE